MGGRRKLIRRSLTKSFPKAPGPSKVLWPFFVSQILVDALPVGGSQAPPLFALHSLS